MSILKKKYYFPIFIFLIILILTCILNYKFSYIRIYNYEVTDTTPYKISFIKIFFRNMSVYLMLGILNIRVKPLFYIVWIMNSIAFGICLSCFQFPIVLFVLIIAIPEISCLFISYFNSIKKTKIIYFFKTYKIHLMVALILFLSAIFEAKVFPFISQKILTQL